jgi:polysaccharide deacetylase family protein (PEP-CTERM system associated)
VVDGLSVDVEDYFQVEAFSSEIPVSTWPQFPLRVRENTLRVLDLFEEYNCRATFFILGWVAEREPSLVREIAMRGHELACHSFYHQQVFKLTPDEFRTDLRRARAAIEDASGTQIIGYRAPTFSIRPDTLWALEILAEEGFLYDSSIFPICHDLYGIPDAVRFVHRREFPGGRSIIEVPMSTARLGGINLPAAGGGVLRLLPLSYTQSVIRQLHRRDQRPAVLYFHPWELDPEQPRLRGSWKSRFRHYTGLKHMENRLRVLLHQGQFEPLIDMVRRLGFPMNLELPTVAASS